MDQKLTDLIEKLSEKLGVKAEFLYKSMIKQVKLNAVINVIQFIVVCFLLIPLLWAWHMLLPHCVPVNPAGQYSFEREWPGEIQLLAGGLAAASIGWLIAIFCCFFNL